MRKNASSQMTARATPTTTQAQENNLSIKCCDPNDLRPALTACTQEIDEMVDGLNEGQKAVFNFGLCHKDISPTLFVAASIAHLHEKYGERLLVAIEEPHNRARKNQHPAATMNAANEFSRYTPYSNAYLYDFLYQNNIATCFNDTSKKEGHEYELITTSNKKTKKFIETHAKLFGVDLNSWQNRLLFKLNIFPNIYACFEQGMFIRDSFMTHTAFERARQDGHDIILQITGAIHALGGEYSYCNIDYPKSLCATQQDPRFTQETITPAVRPIIINAPDSLKIRERSVQFNGRALFLENMSAATSYYDQSLGKEHFYSFAEQEKDTFQQIFLSSGGTKGLKIPKPELLTQYKNNASENIRRQPI